MQLRVCLLGCTLSALMAGLASCTPPDAPQTPEAAPSLRPLTGEPSVPHRSAVPPSATVPVALEGIASGAVTRTPYTPAAMFPPHSSLATYPPMRQWSDVLEFTPFPYSTPLPPGDISSIDGTYAKQVAGDLQWWNCRRCPDYMVAGGNWRLVLDRGVMLFYYEVTGFASVGSFAVQDDRVFIFNDPHCPYVTGEYSWVLEGGALQLQEIRDPCAVELRARNLAQQAWLSCEPPSPVQGQNADWVLPPGCPSVE